jgi:hypothetical protein
VEKALGFGYVEGANSRVPHVEFSHKEL